MAAKTHVRRWWLIGLLVAVLLVAAGGIALYGIRRGAALPDATEVVEEGGRLVRYSRGSTTLTIEFLDDDLVHVELATASGTAGDTIPVSPMIAKTDFGGPGRLVRGDDGAFETNDLRLKVDPTSLCVTAADLTRDPPVDLSEICPFNLERDMRGISLAPQEFAHVYGLGQAFVEPGEPNGDWVGRQRFAGDFGNVMRWFNDGAAGNTQIPVLYFVGVGTETFALFLDDVHKQFFDFTGETWTASMQTDAIRYYVLTGPDLADLRRDYLELTGRPPVPPKKMFGLWVSEYGYESWAELSDKLSTLRAEGFPVDGFVLDLQWYGGIQEGSDDTRMGSLTWDQNAFPDPEAAIAGLQAEQGIGLIAIEQPYVGRNLPEHQDLESRGYLVRDCETCGPVYLTENPWWGKGGMIDWTNPEATAYWHDLKRQPLIEAGLIGHWTDLGEPEAYDSAGWYWGIPTADGQANRHPEVHNLYNFLWSQSIYDGYERNSVQQRPFILSRSGTSGTQRFGVALWSGDLSGLLTTLAAHLNAQMHVAMSGIDYYGSDVGGFWRQDVDMTETYTQWFADSAAIDVPLRPHTFNLGNPSETAPDRIGDPASNLANLRLRYRLVPYLYSLAHAAYRTGEAVFPPLVYSFPEDQEARPLGDEKMIGPSLLVALAAQDGMRERPVYLPAGDWYDFHTGDRLESRGAWIASVPIYTEGLLRLPLYARAGGIIPLMHVDEQTMNAVGLRRDGTVRDELIVRVYAGDVPSAFTLYEDDGWSTAYQQGEVRETVIRQEILPDAVVVTIEAAEGSYEGAMESRQNVIELFSGRADSVTSVALNGRPLERLASEAAFESADAGWIEAADGAVRVKTGELDVREGKEIRFTTTGPA